MHMSGPILLLAIIVLAIVAMKIMNLVLKIFLIVIVLLATSFPFWSHWIAPLLNHFK